MHIFKLFLLKDKKLKLKQTIKISALIVSVLLLYNCSTEKNTALRRNYHNLTSYFNILFNGRESFNEGLEQYKKEYKFDYTRTIPIFIYGDKTLSESIKPQMEVTIEKCSKLIRLHSITAKPENLKKQRKLSKEEKEYYNKSEFNKFVDDSYLLMGKAYFWQMDYYNAEEILEYAINEFKNKKVDQEAKIWTAKSNIELQRFRKAREILTKLSEEEITEKLKAEFQATFADFYLKQDNQDKAIPHLAKAIQYTDKIERKLRYNYILAQLYEDKENYKTALDYYNKVIEQNPDYRMEFNATLKKAWLHKRTDKETDGIKKDIKKMLKDDKNIDYRDQIYYALAKIAIQENNVDEAIKYYKKSAQSSTKNNNQKGISFLELADILFERKNYTQAQAYYDSSITALEEDYPGYTDLYLKNKYLTKLVDNLNTIEFQDSVQKVAQMSPKERNQLIQNLINQYKKKQREEAQKKARQQKFDVMRYNTQQRANNRRQQGGKWYFYSPPAVERGKASFRRKWGERKLEDNWRRSTKNQSEFGNFAEDQQKEKKQEKQFSKSNKKYYMQNIPLNDSLMEASHNKIKEAYFNVGTVYMNDLNNYPKAIDAFETLNKKYPDSKYKLPAYYNLYKLNKELENNSRSQTYKDKIIQQYPETNYAKVLSNPNYFKELEKEKNKIEKMYSETLEDYKNGQYYQVINKANLAHNKFKNQNYNARFAFLKAMAKGKTEDIISYRKSLEKITENYPDTEVGKRAMDMIAYLKKTELEQINRRISQVNKETKDKETSSKETEQKDSEQKETTQKQEKTKNTGETPREEKSSLYTFSKEEPYYFVIIANTEKTDIGQLKFDLINFNLDYFLQKDYTTSSKKFNEFNTVIVVKKFKNYETANKYYNIMNKKEERVFKEISKDNYNYFFISVKNYINLLEKQTIIEYLKFFNNKVI